MIDYELFSKIKHHHEQEGLSIIQIAEALSLDPRTVSFWVKEKHFRKRKSVQKNSKLDPFKHTITRMLDTHRYSAAQILQRIHEEGYTGGYTILRDYVNKIRPKKSPAFLKLAFAPGECAQVDWGSYGSVKVGKTSRRLSFFVMVLCYSRLMYVEFSVSQTMEHFLACHQNAFEFIGAAPSKIMVDNLKSAVLKRITGKAPIFNPRYQDFANHYGFTIMACGVGKGNEKGRVESGVGYVKKNLLRGLDIPDFSALNPYARNWLNTVANVRIHGETRKKPADMFNEERGFLKPLPEHAYDVGNVSPVRASSQFRITVDTNRYSVPARYAGQSLTLKTYPDQILIYHQNDLIARHLRCYDRHQDFEEPDHAKELIDQRKKARDQKIFMRFLALSNIALDYYKELEQRRMNPLHHIRQIVALSEIYGPQKVERALQDAFEFKAFSCEYIVNILEQRSKFVKEQGALTLTRNQDLLDLSIPEPDLNIYDDNEKGV
jgi:transposase